MCQQAAELYLKGLLTLHGVEPPRTHDLVNLWRRGVSVDQKVSPLEDSCRILTEYYIETRYPPEVKSYGRDKAEEAVKLASEVEDLVMRLRKEAKTSGRSEN